MFSLKGHIRSNKALYVYIFSSNNSSVKPLLSLYASLSFLSLSFFFSHSFSSYPSYASLSFLLFFFTLSLFSTPLLPTPTLASYPPYASLSFLSPSFFFSLFFNLNLRSYGQLFVLVYTVLRLHFKFR